MKCSFYFKIIWFIFGVVQIVLLPLQTAQCETATPGLYSGDFFYLYSGAEYSRIDGLFGIFLPNSSSAIIATFPSPTEDTLSNINSSIFRNVLVEPNGSFLALDEHETVCQEGQFSSTIVSGFYFPTWSGPGPEPDESPCEGGPHWGEFSGSHFSNTGPMSAGVGFYEGTITGEVTLQGDPWADISGELFVMVSGDGSSFITVDACAIHGTTCTIADDGGFIQFGEDGIITGNLIKGTQINGSVNISEFETPSCCSAQGTFYKELESELGVFVSSGTWSIEKTIPLPNINDATPKSFPWLMILLD